MGLHVRILRDIHLALDIAALSSPQQLVKSLLLGVMMNIKDASPEVRTAGGLSQIHCLSFVI